MAIAGNWIFCKDSKRLYPDISKRELDEIDFRLKEVVKKSFKDNPTLKKFGWNNDAEEFKTRWQQATHNSISFMEAIASEIKKTSRWGTNL